MIKMKFLLCLIGTFVLCYADKGKEEALVFPLKNYTTIRLAKGRDSIDSAVNGYYIIKHGKNYIALQRGQLSNKEQVQHIGKIKLTKQVKVLILTEEKLEQLKRRSLRALEDIKTNSERTSEDKKLNKEKKEKNKLKKKPPNDDEDIIIPTWLFQEK